MRLRFWLKMWWTQFWGGLKLLFLVVLLCIGVLATISITSHPMSYRHLFATAAFRNFADWEIENSEIIAEVVAFCEPFDNETQVECVVNYMRQFEFNNTRADEDGLRPTLKRTDEFDSGYICRDIAVSYDAIFRRLGWQTDFIWTHTHVYNHIWKIEGFRYCDVNMRQWECW